MTGSVWLATFEQAGSKLCEAGRDVTAATSTSSWGGIGACEAALAGCHSVVAAVGSWLVEFERASQRSWEPDWRVVCSTRADIEEGLFVLAEVLGAVKGARRSGGVEDPRGGPFGLSAAAFVSELARGTGLIERVVADGAARVMGRVLGAVAEIVDAVGGSLLAIGRCAEFAAALECAGRLLPAGVALRQERITAGADGARRPVGAELKLVTSRHIWDAYGAMVARSRQRFGRQGTAFDGSELLDTAGVLRAVEAVLANLAADGGISGDVRVQIERARELVARGAVAVRLCANADGRLHGERALTRRACDERWGAVVRLVGTARDGSAQAFGVALARSAAPDVVGVLRELRMLLRLIAALVGALASEDSGPVPPLLYVVAQTQVGTAGVVLAAVASRLEVDPVGAGWRLLGSCWDRRGTTSDGDEQP